LLKKELCAFKTEGTDCPLTSVKMNFIIWLDSTKYYQDSQITDVALGEVRNACKVSVKIVKARDCLGCKHRWEDSIKLDLTEAVCEDMDWI
jgi:hypothetical protein